MTAATPRVAAAGAPPVPRGLWLALGGLAFCLGWSYWPTLCELREAWARSAEFSVGALVPITALVLAWRDRAALLAAPRRPCAWGLLLLLAAEGLRQGGTWFGVGSGERYALVVAAAGVVLAAAGWAVFRRLQWVLAFLLLMIPLPARVHEALALPLQRFATAAAAAVLELAGFFVQREGHVLRLDEQTTIGVAEACSGLRMLTAFVFVAALLAFLITRPWWHKALLLLASLPIAVFSNAVRTVTTALVIHYAHDPRIGETYHDLAGFAMMPLALLLSLALLEFLAWLTAPEPGAGAPAGRGRAARGGAAAGKAPQGGQGVAAPRPERVVKQASRTVHFVTGGVSPPVPEIEVNDPRFHRHTLLRWLPRPLGRRGRS